MHHARDHFASTDEELESDFRAAAREFVARTVEPVALTSEAEKTFPMSVWKGAATAGFTGLTCSANNGGEGAPLRMQTILVEEVAYECAGIASAFLGLGTGILNRYGSMSQVDTYLRPSIAGDQLGCFAMTEPEAGSDVLGMRARAVREDARWRVTGQKTYITAAPISSFAVTVAYTGAFRDRNGLSLFVVPLTGSEVEIRTMDKLGHHSMPTGEIWIDGFFDEDAIIGLQGEGLEIVTSFLDDSRTLHAARSLGVARRAYAEALEHARVRTTFGKPLVRHQVVEMMLARLWSQIAATELTVAAAAYAIDNGSAKARVLASQAKLQAAETAVDASRVGLQVLGGTGYMSESIMSRLLRDAALYPISEGTSEMQLRTISAANGFKSGL